MPIYVIAVAPLLLIVLEIMTTENTVKMAAYADDFTGSGSIKCLKRYWDTLCKVASKFGYYLEAKKSWLYVVKFLKDLSLMKCLGFFWKQTYYTSPIRF